jgi:hypothetical protein
MGDGKSDRQTDHHFKVPIAIATDNLPEKLIHPLGCPGFNTPVANTKMRVDGDR